MLFTIFLECFRFLYLYDMYEFVVIFGGCLDVLTDLHGILYLFHIFICMILAVQQAGFWRDTTSIVLSARLLAPGTGIH